MTVEQQIIIKGGRAVPHSKSSLMRVLCWAWPRMRQRWMTLGRTIYYPDGADIERNRVLVDHELVHVAQMRRYTVPLFLFLYFCVLPFGLAYFRWRFEREAYLVNIRARERSAVDCARVLWSGYGWTWPQSWAVRWFREHA